MSIQVKFFGPLVDIIGKTQLEFDDVTDTHSLKQRLLSDFPKLKNHHFLIAVGKQIINSKQILNVGDEVALLPPFAGG